MKVLFLSIVTAMLALACEVHHHDPYGHGSYYYEPHTTYVTDTYTGSCMGYYPPYASAPDYCERDAWGECCTWATYWCDETYCDDGDACGWYSLYDVCY